MAGARLSSLRLEATMAGSFPNRCPTRKCWINNFKTWLRKRSSVVGQTTLAGTNMLWRRVLNWAKLARQYRLTLHLWQKSKLNLRRQRRTHWMLIHRCRESIAIKTTHLLTLEPMGRKGSRLTLRRGCRESIRSRLRHLIIPKVLSQSSQLKTGLASLWCSRRKT